VTRGGSHHFHTIPGGSGAIEHEHGTNPGRRHLHVGPDGSRTGVDVPGLPAPPQLRQDSLVGVRVYTTPAAAAARRELNRAERRRRLG
jgi:hypothetical protein